MNTLKEQISEAFKQADMTGRPVEVLNDNGCKVLIIHPKNGQFIISDLNDKVEDLTQKLQKLTEEYNLLKESANKMNRCLHSIKSEFEDTVRYADFVASGSKGMSVPFHGDFASAIKLPSVINRMRWWIKIFKGAVAKEPNICYQNSNDE